MGYFLVFLIIAIAIGIGVVVYKGNADRWSAEKAQGNIIERKTKFWDEETYFFTNTSYEEIKKQVLNNDFSSGAKLISIDLINSGNFSQSTNGAVKILSLYLSNSFGISSKPTIFK